MANMNNEIFSVLRKNQFLAVFRRFFADVSKNFKTRYLKNRLSDEAHLLTQVSYNESNSDRPLDKQLMQYLVSSDKKFKNYFFGENAWSAKNLPKFEF